MRPAAAACGGLDAVVDRLRPGALLLAIGRLGVRGAGLCAGVRGARLLVLVFAVLAPVALWVGVAQRLAFGVWFAWLVLASR